MNKLKEEEKIKKEKIKKVPLKKEKIKKVPLKKEPLKKVKHLRTNTKYTYNKMEETNTVPLIKHLVISGGSVNGFYMYGALKHCNQCGLWKYENLKSIWGTSVGAILATIVCLQFDWTTLDTYIINRPWEDVFEISGEMLFNSYSKKGMFDITIIREIFKPLLLAKSLSLDITFAELYSVYPIELHFFSFDLNGFTTVEISHKTFPNLSVLTGIAMSSALPGAFAPVFLPECADMCFIDGGICCNYPLNKCLKEYEDKEQVLGITLDNNDTNVNAAVNPIINNNSNILDFFTEFASKISGFLDKLEKKQSIPYEIRCSSSINVFEWSTLTEVIKNASMRKQWIQQGVVDAEKQIK